MRMNNSMRTRWERMNIQDYLGRFAFANKLKLLTEAPIIETPDGIILEPLAQPHISASSFQDRTGYEAFINHVHVSDFVDPDELRQEKPPYLLVQGFLFMNRIRDRLNGRWERFRIILSLDRESEEVTVRFYMLRPNEVWCVDDIDEYSLEDIILEDT